ncbi:hypothetical protein M885DRAFT_626123 [Pelagophyceae sp. CCMP2097]|nr:hypothetical protein M885DRAFT_626123 [Pelagophyceae sp. CCMP2097]
MLRDGPTLELVAQAVNVGARLVAPFPHFRRWRWTMSAAVDVRDIFESAEQTLALHGETLHAAAAVQDIRVAFYATQAHLEADFATKERALEAERAAMLHEVDDKLARGEVRLEAERAAVDRRRAALEDAMDKMASGGPHAEQVKLNVGGTRFETSRTVLTKVEDSMLALMFGRCDTMLQADPEDGSR